MIRQDLQSHRWEVRVIQQMNGFSFHTLLHKSEIELHSCTYQSLILYGSTDLHNTSANDVDLHSTGQMKAYAGSKEGERKCWFFQEKCSLFHRFHLRMMRLSTLIVRSILWKEGRQERDCLSATATQYSTVITRFRSGPKSGIWIDISIPS